jgi:hypothetical protein
MAQQMRMSRSGKTGAIVYGNGSSVSLASRKGSDAVPFDAEEMKKHRMMYEASANKNANGSVGACQVLDPPVLVALIAVALFVSTVLHLLNCGWRF